MTTTAEAGVEPAEGGWSAAIVVPEEELRYASHSSITTHRECPQRWFYRSVRGLRKIEGDDAAVERDFGSWAHAMWAADALERGRALGTLKWVPDELTTVDDGPTLKASTATVDEVLGLAVVWWAKQNDAVKSVWLERLGQDLPGRLEYVFARYVERWAAEREAEEPLAVELHWERRLPPVEQPGRGLVDPKAVLVGYVDKIYRDRRRGIIVVRDHKFHKKLGTQSTADDMMDSQLQLYAWGASPIVTAWGLGPIRATQFDRVRMIKPSQPAVTASGGLSKSTTDYDLHTYLTWARQGVTWGEEGKFFASGPRKDLPKFGRYEVEEKEVERLSTPSAIAAWHQRTGPTPLNANIIKAHLRAAVDSALDMQNTYERARIEQAAARNLGSACRWCDFSELCRTEMFGGHTSLEPADFGLYQIKRSGR
jgi:hypothetical protein